MKLLREFIRSVLLLTEGRLEDVKKKYPDAAVGFLSAHDPSGNNAYLDWMAKQSENGEDDDKIISAIAAFHRAKQKLDKRDINAYKDIAELRSVLASKSLPKVSGAELIAQNDEWYLLYIKSKRACIQLGAKDTNWCITQASMPHWENYVAQGAVFFFCIPKIPVETEDAKLGDKYAISVIKSGDSILETQVWASDDTALATNQAESILGPELIQKAEEFAKSIPESIMSRISRGTINVEELDQYLDTLNSPEKVQDIFSSLNHHGPAGDISSWINSKYAPARISAVFEMPKEEVLLSKDKLLSDPDPRVLTAVVWRLPKGTPEFVRLAGTKDPDLFYALMTQSIKKAPFIEHALELGNFDCINRYYTQILVDATQIAALLIKYRNEIDAAVLNRCAVIIVRHLSNEDDKYVDVETAVYAIELCNVRETPELKRIANDDTGEGLYSLNSEEVRAGARDKLRSMQKIVTRGGLKLKNYD